MLSRNRMSALRREPIAAERIPCSTHVAPNVVKTVFGDYLQVLRLGGASFETADDDRINTLHELLNVLWRNIASPNVALWTHVVRRRERVFSTPERVQGFADALGAKYARRLAGEALMVNELFVAIVYRPAVGMATGTVSRLLSNVQPTGSRLELAEALDACEKLAQVLRASLARYEPETLGSYLVGAVWCSSLLEYLGLLVNGEWRCVPLPRGAVNEVLVTTRLFFGTEAIEYRMPSETRVGAMLWG